uniref:ATP-binding protein n=1 Tax=Clostridium perfringens TaxID=1502 RepID=UPI0032DB4304
IFGGYALIFDPKGERNDWVKYLPWLEGLITTVRLTGDEKYRGMLDPFNIYKDNIEDAIELAVNIVSELNRLTPKDDEFIVLKESVVKIKEDENKSMIRLIEILEDYSAEDEL